MKPTNWILLAAAFVLLGFSVLLVRLAEVQVTDASKYGYQNARQSIRRIQTEGVRGSIYDRRGVPLAINHPSLSLVCEPAAFEKRKWEDTIRAIERAMWEVQNLIGRNGIPSRKTIERHVNQSLAIPLVVWRNLTEREVQVFAEHQIDFPGFEIEETWNRVYPEGSLAAHVIGYVGRDRGESDAGDEKIHYFDLEMKGRSGLESYYNSYLCGVPGEKKVVVDARGFAIREWTALESRPGLDLKLSLDARLQRVVEETLVGQKGACAVLDPRTGEVLALASAPTYDLNDFVPLLATETYERYVHDPDLPLLNRASGALYAPGSTFKPITALAALSLGVSGELEYACSGVYELGDLHLRCARRWGHGTLALREALQESCNPYFCNLAMDIGTNALVKAARALGLGAKTGLDLGVDLAGIVPTGDWKYRRYHEPWYPGDLAQMGIGQGMLLTSPLQMARVAGAIGTGYLVTPHLKAGSPIDRRPIPFASRDLAVVREGMDWVVNGHDSSRGGGWRAGEAVAVRVCGKTGTAEVGKGVTRRKNTWFIAYAPAENPRIALALVVENGEAGATTAATRVNAILKFIFGTVKSL